MARNVNTNTGPLTALLVYLFTLARDTSDQTARNVACQGIAEFVGGSLVEGQPPTVIEGAEEWKVDRMNELLREAFPGITRGTRFVSGGGDDLMAAAVSLGIADLPREEIVKRLRAAFPEKAFSEKPAGHKINLGCTFGWLAEKKAAQEKAEKEAAEAKEKAEKAEAEKAAAEKAEAEKAEPKKRVSK